MCEGLGERGVQSRWATPTCAPLPMEIVLCLTIVTGVHLLSELPALFLEASIELLFMHRSYVMHPLWR